VAHTVAFLIDQKQDFYLSLAWSRLLRQRGSDCSTLVVLTHGTVLPEFERHLDGFDRVEITDAPSPPRTARMLPGMVVLLSRFRRAVRQLGLTDADAVVVYSYQALVATGFIRALRTRPRFVRVRQCNHALDDLLVRRRIGTSFYLNLWNRFGGTGAMRYRWLPSSNRSGGGTFIRDPYDDEFCLTAASKAVPDEGRLAWPFPVIRPASESSGKPTLVFLGEQYPLEEGQPIDELRVTIQGVLDRVRELHPQHRLVFKPRSHRSEIGLDLTGWEPAAGDTLLESLLIDDPSIAKVISFKSSGSTIASQYGCAAYLLYPLLDLADDVRAHLDGYFEAYRDDVTFVDDIEQLAGAGPARSIGADRVAELSAPLIDLLARPR
jgi:hypothetical protein